MINIRNYIIGNFKNDNKEDIKNAINDSINSKEEEPLIGLGVFFELLWNNSTNEEKDEIAEKIRNVVNI